ncbi:isoprenylcysteine carboxylmethyltransferase family protein [Ginsengibacter hankyongi]|uniref:methanethiol S-methyltransferase n=1 Tax=Ginsengibacter hankyongi TaxID=2607284 RepID=A0A5J5IF55_9BACT|nr:methanethiol S-methyltransferase [Ginsengibacter hankyongi]KAA9038369.1 isoprenylcysteine carboxylmethyltransferase family protein [Ginsengibacter hankyongi]
MKKLIVFLYGIIAYVVFLVAFLYAIGFVGNFIVPKTIDSGVGISVTQALLFDSLLLGLFAIQHSVMARPAFKKWWTNIIPSAIERSTYVLLSSLILVLLYWQWQPITSVVWKTENKTAVTILNAVYFFGWLIVFLSTFMINHFELFGLKQIFENLLSRQKQVQHPVLKMIFFYQIVRHPIMLGFIIAFWATPVMTMGHLIFAITTTLYILIAIKFLEEKDLRKIHGQEYEEYQKKVPMIVPFTGKGTR